MKSDDVEDHIIQPLLVGEAVEADYDPENGCRNDGLF